MLRREKEAIGQLVGTIIVLVVFFGGGYFIANLVGKSSCENKWGDKGKYVGVLGGCLVKTKQGYIPEERLYNLNQLNQLDK